MAESRSKKKAPLPTREQILRFIKDTPARVSKREIARAFHIKGADRAWLKSILKDLAAEGLLEHGRKRRLAEPGSLPPVAVVEISDVDVDGELHARPVNWRHHRPPPAIMMAPPRPGLPALGVGDKALVRLEKEADGVYAARTIRQIQAAPDKILGVFTQVGRDGRVQPTDRRVKYEIAVAAEDARETRSGELVLVEVLPGRALGLRRGRVAERLGGMDDPRSISLIAVHTHGIPTTFPTPVIAEAEKAKPVRLNANRIDLRDVPLITIDPEDARDHDDAVWAAPDEDPANPGGWRIIVAIADVAHYVRPDSALDREAVKRGNSVYFPDRVVPMLPEALSNTLCSLQPGVQRPCLAVRIWIDADGRKLRHRFQRGLMRSVANLTYRQAQAARDGMAGEVAAPLVDDVINPLFDAYAALARARDARGPLAIDVPERRVVIGADGYISSIHQRDRLEAHRLIEEFMIAANVCAAETCEELGQPCMYRVHEDPDPAKVDALRDFLDSLNIRLAKGQRLRPALFNGILEKVTDTPNQHVVNEVVLRTQSQAVYSPDNLGHFGLALQRYAHFTSPIRRYADLLVHRAIIRGIGSGKDGLPDDSVERFPELGEQISKLERRAMSAERDALDRFTAAFMADRVDATFMGRISGVTRFGLFVSLDETGADGLVPVGTLEDDYYDHDERRHRLVGRRRGRVFRLGDRVEVRLVEADAITGGLRLEVLRDEGPTVTGDGPGTRGKRGSRPFTRTGNGRKKAKSESRKTRRKK